MIIERVKTRDIDLLVVENIVRNPDFARLFMGDVGGAPLALASIKFWKNDDPGEPDVTAVFETEKGRVMLLLEDNVAKTVKRKSQEKIEKIGKRAVGEGLCDACHCCLIAPKNDLEANAEELEGFPAVSFEALREALAGDAWSEFMIDRAIAERAQPYSAKKNDRIVAFWDRYYRRVRNVFPDLNMKRYEEETGFQSTTAKFTTKVPGISIQHKANDGLVDVMVKLKDYSYEQFDESMRPYLFDGMDIRPKGKNALFVMEVPVIHLSGSFDAQVRDLDRALEAVVEMQEFMQELDYGRMEQIIQEGIED